MCLLNEKPIAFSGQQLNSFVQCTALPQKVATHYTAIILCRIHSVVEFEQQGEIPGVKFTTACGDEGWTPVVSRRRKKCASSTSLMSVECSESSDDKLQFLKSARSVVGMKNVVVSLACLSAERVYHE